MELCVVPPVYCHAESSGCDYSKQSVIFHFLQCIKTNCTVWRLAFFSFLSFCFAFSLNSIRYIPHEEEIITDFSFSAGNNSVSRLILYYMADVFTPTSLCKISHILLSYEKSKTKNNNNNNLKQG